MIPKTDGDATPLCQRPPSVLLVVYRIWASARMGQLEDWFRSWVPDSVLGAGDGRGSVEAWYATALDTDEVLTGATDSDTHLFVGDVIKSFDTVDRSVLDRVLSSLGLPAWFRNAYFGALMWSLCSLPGERGRFVRCSICADHCWLRHIGWETCGHGAPQRLS